MLLSFVIATLVHRVVSPDLLALTVLEIVLPLAFIACAILMDVDSIPVGLIIKPLALEDVAVHVPELAVTTGFIEAPVAFVLSTVFPDLHAISVLHVTQPLSGVSGTILEMDFSALLELRLIDVLHIEVRIIHREAVVGRCVIMLVGVHLKQLRADPLSRDDAARPCL